MAGTINYLYDPNQIVWVIESTSCDNTTILSVQTGRIIQVIGSVLNTGSTLLYNIRLDGSAGTKSFIELDVFPDLTTATTEYEVRLT